MTSKCPDYDCAMAPELHFQAEKPIFASNTGAHFTLMISTDQRFDGDLGKGGVQG